ncbi:MAG: MarR family winged helix-turn-helix transcriptional regulator [Thermomicrobiales bacterium]|jgi:DNA-binding MarR family transcriptional regulator|nr:MarR family transcriptional regulator [Thermomicrobiales bacterium]
MNDVLEYTPYTEIQGGGARNAAVLAWLRLTHIYQRVDRATAVRLRAADLSVAQFDVLVHLGAAEGLTQQELADSLLVTKGNISQLIAKMERRGLIRRCQDGRAMNLFLTDEGRRLRETAVPAHEAWLTGQFAGLTAEETRTLLTLLRKLDHSLADEVGSRE